MGLELKKGDQVQFLVDRSGSMDTGDCNGETRYNHVREKLKAFVRGASKVDPDGVSIHFFNNRVETHPNVANVDTIDQLIDQHRPGGGTATHLAIQAAWNEHRSSGSTATFVVAFTDGEPSEPDAVKSVLVNITNAMTNPEEFRISFLTVGVQSASLKAWLSALDSDLKGAKYDIVAVEELDNVDFEGAIADLIGSSTTATEAAAGQTGGKTTTQI